MEVEFEDQMRSKDFGKNDSNNDFQINQIR